MQHIQACFKWKVIFDLHSTCHSWCIQDNSKAAVPCSFVLVMYKSLVLLHTVAWGRSYQSVKIECENPQCVPKHAITHMLDSLGPMEICRTMCEQCIWTSVALINISSPPSEPAVCFSQVAFNLICEGPWSNPALLGDASLSEEPAQWISVARSIK